MKQIFTVWNLLLLASCWHHVLDFGECWIWDFWIRDVYPVVVHIYSAYSCPGIVLSSSHIVSYLSFRAQP